MLKSQNRLSAYIKNSILTRLKSYERISVRDTPTNLRTSQCERLMQRSIGPGLTNLSQVGSGMGVLGSVLTVFLNTYSTTCT